jgi:hypothetical protein
MLASFCLGSKKEDYLQAVNLEFIPRVGEIVRLLLPFDDGLQKRTGKEKRFRVHSVEHKFKPNNIGDIIHTVEIVVDPL